MKRLLKYLLPVLMAAAFLGCTDDRESAVSLGTVADMTLGTETHAAVSSSEYDFLVPRPTSFTSAQRVQGSARRTGSVHRNSLEFAKSGKIINAGLRYFIQVKSLIAHSSLIEPAHRLLYLGKLII